MGTEMIENGGFEDGLNNWNHDLGAWLFGFGHTGSDACELDEAVGWIEQTLTSETLVACVTTFECWFYPERFSCCNHFKLIVTYTDDSTSEHLFNEYQYDDEWHLLNLKPYLTAGKTIKKIRFEESNGFSAVDDISMIVEELAEGTVVIDSEPYECIIKFRERQGYKVPIKEVPTCSSGSFVDTGTYTLKNRRLSIEVRLTDAKKASLQATFDGRAEVTITAGDWTYIGWFVKKPLVYEYSVNGDGDIREWIVEMEFVLSSFSYSP